MRLYGHVIIQRFLEVLAVTKVCTWCVSPTSLEKQPTLLRKIGLSS